MDTNPIITYALVISILILFIPTFLIAGLHKNLRNNSIYYTLLILAFGMLFLTIYQVDANWTDELKRQSLSPISIIIYLLLYKLIDYIALKKYKRNIYFYSRISNYIEDGESLNSTFFEFCLQSSIFMISTFSWAIIPSEFINKLF
jgi:hypothetical protein